jgi:hypothetical protein
LKFKEAQVEAKKAPVKKAAAKKAATKTTAAKQAAATQVPVAKKAEPTQEQIAELARKYFHQRGGHDGSAEQDWLRAERELKGS